MQLLSIKSAYYSIQDKYTEQARLLEEASGLFELGKAERHKCSKSCLALKRSCNADIQQAVSKVVSQYQTHLNAAQTCTCKHQVAIQQLRE